ncbi:MAG TPA: hypothetical protein DGG95_00525 [Cytophagales bacterium]|nr:hypothetical protein [Cytophagales bacterium]
MFFSNLEPNSYFCKNKPLRLCDCIPATTTAQSLRVSRVKFDGPDQIAYFYLDNCAFVSIECNKVEKLLFSLK